MAVADRACDVEEVAEQVEEAAGNDQEVLHEEVGLWRVEAGIGGLDYEVGTLKGAGEFEGHGCWFVMEFGSPRAERVACDLR